MVFSAHERLETCDLVHVNALKRVTVANCISQLKDKSYIVTI